LPADVVFIEVAHVQLEEATWPETVHSLASRTTVWSRHHAGSTVAHS